MSPAFTPAISDVDLVRLLGFCSTVTAAPADLADRIMAALPVAAERAQPLPALPILRRTAGRRWLRGGLTMVAGLGLATAVAAGLARTPLFAPVLAPVMARIAEATGLPALAPTPATTPAPTLAPKPTQTAGPIPRLTVPAEPVRNTAALPPPASVPLMMPPALVPAPAVRATLVPRPGPVIARLAQPAGARAPIEGGPRRERLSGSERPLIRDQRPAIGRPAAPERPTLQDLPVVMEPMPARGAAVASETPPAGTAVPLPGSDGPPPASTTDTEGSIGTDRVADTATELAALRKARKSGSLTTEQAQRLRSLQQLRALRAGRPPRERARR